MNISVAEYRKLARKPKKYRNKPQRIDGVYFASTKESRRYGELVLLQNAGLIHGLVCHPRFPLLVFGQEIGEYIADFQYYERGKKIIEDVKSKATRLPLYRWKAKHLKAQYQIEVREV